MGNQWAVRITFLERGGGSLLEGRARGFQLAPPFFALVDEFVGRRFDDVVELAALLLRFHHRVRHLRLRLVDPILHRSESTRKKKNHHEQSYFTSNGSNFNRYESTTRFIPFRSVETRYHSSIN